MYFKTQIIEWQDTLYKVKRILHESTKIDIHFYKEYLRVDKIAKRHDYYYFLEQILEPEVEYIENKNELTVTTIGGQDPD